MRPGTLTFIGKPCSKCGEQLRYQSSGACIKCNADKTAAWKEKYYSGGAEYIAGWRDRNPLKSMIINSRARAKRLDIYFNIGESDVVFTTECPCCGDPLDFSRKQKICAQSPTLDRLNPGEGYIAGNVSMICWACNHVKNATTLERIEAVARWMRRQQPAQ